jgi:hypothetical protein
MLDCRDEPGNDNGPERQACFYVALGMELAVRLRHAQK